MTYLSGNKTYPVIIPCPVFDNFELSPTIYSMCGLVVFYGDINKQFSGCGYFICESKSSTVIMNIYYYFLSISYHSISYHSISHHDPHMRCKGLCNNVAYNHLTLLNS